MTREQVQVIDDLLPQTQCTQCGFEGCLPYAQAIVFDDVPINRCPPGGEVGIARLAELLGRPPLPLDNSCGQHKPLEVAWIDEQHCIGCTLCIRACPVDAIVGVNKYMHTVLPDLCSGCGLCVAPCPVDCITMQPAGREWTDQDAQGARHRHQAVLQRQTAQQEKEDEVSQQQTASDLKQALIAKALAKARARRGE